MAGHDLAVRHVVVTGAAGNLGAKLVAHLLQSDWCDRVTAFDREPALAAAGFQVTGKLRPVGIDLSTTSTGDLVTLMGGADAVVHFATLNSTPDCSWPEAVASFDMTAQLLAAAGEVRAKRFVFASSNHVMGRYKDPPLSGSLTPSCLTTDLAAPGTRWETPDGPVDAYAYGAGKLFGERLCQAMSGQGGLSSVSIRVGWCQVGANHPATINAGGNPKLAALGKASTSSAQELAWYRNMWLSTPDFCHLFERAILSGCTDWPGHAITINGVSANAGMAWDIDPARSLIGYRPQDNVWDHV